MLGHEDNLQEELIEAANESCEVLDYSEVEDGVLRAVKSKAVLRWASEFVGLMA